MEKQEIIQNIQHQNISLTPPIIDYHNILLNRAIKFLLNFLLIYISTSLIVYNYDNLTINQLILIVCAISSIVFYILDMNFPSCYI